MPGTSALYTKIHSYAIERGIEFDEAYTTTPIRTGTSTVGTAWSFSGTPITYESSVYPLNGNGSWNFTGNTTANLSSRFRSLSANVDGHAMNDEDYSVGFWIKFNSLPGGTSLTVFNFFSILPTNSSTGFTVYVSGSENTGGNASKITFATASAAVIGESVADLGWHYIAIRRVGNAGTNMFYYMDGALVGTESNDGTSTSNATINFGNSTSGSTNIFTYNISNYYHTTSSMIGPTEIAEIWTAGSSSTGIDVTITETPATATNAHFPEPIVSTTIGISFGTEPAIANAEAVNPSISGSANNQETFASASALMTDPTLVFTFNDNTEIATSITASAEFINPYSFGGEINISTSAQLMEASATIEQHTAVAGVSISYSADIIGTASAVMVEPFRFGSDNLNYIATPMIASNAVLQGDVYIEANYFNLVKSLNPLLYAYGSSVNYGSSNPTTLSKDSGYSYASAGYPLSSINDGNGYMLTTDTNSIEQLTWTGQIVADLKTMHKTATFSYEYWFNPATSTWTTGGVNAQTIYSNNYFAFSNTGQTTTNANFKYQFLGNSLWTHDFSIPKLSLTTSNWHHLVTTAGYNTSNNIVVKTYLDGQIVNSVVVSGYTLPPSEIDSRITQFQFNSSNTYGSPANSSYDEIAIYSIELSGSQVYDHYNFINTLSPNRTFFVEPLIVDAIFPEPVIIREENRNFPATPITGSVLFVDPAISVQQNLNFATTPGIASAIAVNPSFYGTPDYRKDAEVLTAFAEMSNNNFALDDTYYSYVQTNIAPFRYVTFDGSNPASDYGTDNDYSVVPTVYGGTATLPSFGINNISVKTAGTNYTTDGVILKESEWNDDWGTGQNTNHSSFWIKRAGNDTSSTGIRVLWNLNGYKDNQHAILYQNNNKLHLQFNNGSGTFVDQATVADVNLFDYERHHVVIGFDHSNNNNNAVKLYVDGSLVMTVSLGAYTGTTTNYATSQPANDEAYNKPRLGIGCLITPFASTALSSVPVNTKLYIDEIHWAKTGLTNGQVASLYAAMPMRDVVEWYADFFLATNATLVNPTFGVSCGVIATPLTASALNTNVLVSTQYGRNVGSDPMTASALQTEPTFFGNDVREINFAANMMLASGILVSPEIIISIVAQPMNATAKMPSSLPPWYDPYRALVIQQSLTYPAGNYFGFRIGDIDE